MQILLGLIRETVSTFRSSLLTKVTTSQQTAMDTLDKAAGLADWQVADAVNKEWLVSSAELRLRRQLESSLERSIRQASSRSYGTNKLATNSYHSINGHPYDNISYAVESCNEKQAAQDNSSGKFRLWLAAFVLLGITLANYSRNALSLAALGMLAKNAINRELVDLISSSSSDLLRNSTSIGLALDDGSCPLAGLVQQEHRLADTPTSNSHHAHLLRASVKQRVESGDLVDWTLGEQGLISAAGSVGNLLIAIPLTRLGEIHGPKWIIFAALSGATLQAALMPPVAAHCGVWLVMLFQLVFNGLTYGADCVAYTLFAHWLAPTELAFFVSCLIICYQLGAMLSSLITTKILSAGLAWSWCFYAPAILCAIWTVIWALIGASQPSLSRLISSRELEYLEKNSKIAQSTRGQRADSKQLPAGAHPVSWCKLARDPNIWAIISVKFTLRWYFSAHSALMPTYLATIGHLSVDTIGTMSLVQSLIGLIAGLLMGYLTKSLINSRLFSLSLASTRKCFQSIVNFGLALSLLVFIIYDCNQWVTIVSLTVGVLCLSFLVAAAVQLPLDLSPTHCGLITSITNTLALGQALGAPISGLILTGASKDRWRWRCVWAVASGLNLISGLLFITLVDSKARDYTQDDRRRRATTETRA